MARVDIEELKIIDNVDKLADIFTHRLNYDYELSPISTRYWKEDLADSILDRDIKLLAKHEDFHIIYCRIENLLLGIERPIVNQLLKEHPYLLVIFADKFHKNLHFVNIKYDEEIKNRRLFRRIVIGPDERLHTAAERINKLEIIDDKIGSLEVQKKHDESFDVEEVTKEFYNTFTDIFHILDKDIAEENPQLDTAKQAQIILNRLIFLYFIQKKSWLNNNKRYLYENFVKFWKKEPKSNSFYSDFLVKLFQALSCQGNLYKDMLGDIPFLNGGLFEVSPFTITPKLQSRLIIKNSTFKRIFDELLEHFNFTVREDTPLDVEVAIDPEMLGKIFENLVLKLEKGEDLRKKTGSYYTPRVIVHFMCQESLKEYLVTESEIERPKIELLFKMNPADQLTEEEIKSLEDSFTLPQARLLKSFIKKAYVLDPAVGSGAFLVGMLHGIVSVIKLLDIREFGKEYIQKVNYDYELKRQLIETCLYGVDIQEQAVRICELRLWLSLIVDYEKVEGEEVPPLPNLNYKIRCGDSLIEKLFGHNVQLDQLVQTDKGKQLIDEIKEDKEAYFLERDIKEKNRIELSTLAKQCELMELLIKEKQKSLTGPQLSFFEETVKECRQREEFEKTKREYEQILLLVQNTRQKVESMLKGKMPLLAEDIHELKQKLGISFIWKLDFAEVFKERGGFDVVIGNPPYLSTKRGFGKVNGMYLVTNYQTAIGQYDAYNLFMEKSIRLNQDHGIFSMIIPKPVFTNEEMEPIRNYFLINNQINILADVGKPFEAGVESAIIISTKEKDASGKVKCIRWDFLLDNIKETLIEQDYFRKRKNKMFLIGLTNEKQRVLECIEKDATPLCELVTFTRGIEAGKKDKSILRENIPNAEPLLTGDDVHPFHVKFAGIFIKINTRDKKKFKESTIYKINKKILVRRVASRLIATVDYGKHYTLNTIYNGRLLPHSKVPEEFIVGLLNSKLINFWFHYNYVFEDKLFPYVRQSQLSGIPIKIPTSSIEINLFKNLVLEIIAIYNKHHLTSDKKTEVKQLEHQIDQKVYELYGLTEKENKLVEEGVKRDTDADLKFDMWHLYLDESGDLGFDFVNKKPSKFFTVTILALSGTDKNRALINVVRHTLKRKLGRKRRRKSSDLELKGSKTSWEVKNYFYRQVRTLKFGLYSITLNKKRLYQRLTKEKERVYNYVARLVLDRIPFEKALTRVELIVDKSKSKPEIEEFNSYIIRQLQGRLDPKIPLDIYHRLSYENLGLQAVDVFCWGIFRKYERKDLAWFNIFAKEKVIFDELYLP